jgi:hypothetical protein
MKKFLQTKQKRKEVRVGNKPGYSSVSARHDKKYTMPLAKSVCSSVGIVSA